MREDQLVKRILVRAEHPARIYKREADIAPLGRLSNDIARRSGDRRDNRATRPGDSVEERRLADVGPADEDYRRRAGGAFHRHTGM